MNLEQFAIHRERIAIQVLWFGLGLLSVLATLLFATLWLAGSSGIDFTFPFNALLATIGWFAYGLSRKRSASQP